MAILLPAALKIMGIAFASSMIGKQLEERGHGGKVVFINIIGQLGCAYIALDLVVDSLHHFAALLGV
ncbi:hypothetical protein [Paenibacillus sp. sgz302251]|uniref:hypothetical protein n=1 Tax=Paenibacillus sp. sgz302251 TaxID=3414493 RepID=UPI003C7B4010